MDMKHIRTQTLSVKLNSTTIYRHFDAMCE